jgi:hypothetical protein
MNRGGRGESRRRTGEVVDNAFEAVFEAEDVEVDEEADFEMAEFEIRQKLGFEQGVQFLDGLQFDNHNSLNE